MSEESTRRLENAMAKLAETSAQHDERLAAHDERMAAHEEQLAAHNERLAAIERTNEMLRELAADHQQLIANMQRRVTGLEESRAMLVELLGSHHDGITEMRAAQANADAKIAALADAQIRTEAAMERGNERVRTALAQLAESQTHTDQRLDALIDIVRGGRNGQSENQPE
jgi:chromosome segregation ATPase